jgi:glycine/D-amino acid oxidase-like deaminating enzyme
MKVGVTRPEPKAGFPKTTETPSSTSTPSQASPAADGATEPAGSSPTEAPASAAASQEDDDEFAAFREAAAKADAADTAAAASVPPRAYTDADLGALCNQAAVKMNDPAPVKALIAEFVPQGEVAHSRNVPADKRADFVKAVEAKAGIEFAG